MNQYPIISIVTPSYNQGKFIEDTIQSVLIQNYPNVEHIIVDNCSTDGTVEILKKYPFLKWISEPDKGQADALNKGFHKATGDIIAYLNSDDQYCPGVFLTVADYFLEHPECKWLCGNVIFTDSKGMVYVKKKPLYSLFILRFATSSIYQPNVFFRRQILEEIGYLREDFHTIMDQEWFCRIAEYYAPEIIDKDFAIFRLHSQSKSFSGPNTSYYKRYIEERKIIFSHYFPFIRPILKIAPIFTINLLHQTARVVKLWKRLKIISKRISS
jgi:glycosyltransferase involved in cell wall biosynthesis